MSVSAMNPHSSSSFALITGACSGIGLAMAHNLAARGRSLLLVSNRAEPLEQAAANVRAQHGVTVHTLVRDLAQADAAVELEASVRAMGLEIDVLINNAGFFFFGEAVDAHPSRAQSMLHLHVITPSLLCTLFGAHMRERRRGYILNVSSISAWRAFPGIAYYGSTKSYLRSFSASLRSELSVYGVSVTCLAPGATFTGLYDPSVVPVTRAKRLGIMMDADVVAGQGLKAMFARRAVCIPGVLTRLMLLGARLLPQALIDLARKRAPWLPMKGESPALKS